MKKVCISFLIFLILVLSVVGLSFGDDVNTEYLRIHVRANSNSQTDQSVKYAVKDAIVNFLTPYLAECKTKEKAEETVISLEKDIERIADQTLTANGFSYESDAIVKTEEFPTRVYDGLVLNGGYYDALIINLGDGAGDNWWCVVYPPLCFTGGNASYVYKSKIFEVINDFFKERKEEK